MYSILRLNAKLKFECNHKAQKLVCDLIYMCAIISSFSLFFRAQCTMYLLQLHLHGLVLRQAIKVSCFCDVFAFTWNVLFFRHHCLHFATSTLFTVTCVKRLAFNRYKATLFAIDANTNVLSFVRNWLHSETSEVMTMFNYRNGTLF